MEPPPPPNLQDVEDDVPEAARWMRFETSWDKLQEDDMGRLRAIPSEDRARKRKMLVSDAQAVRRGMQRHLYLVIDCSKGMLSNDMKPTRLRMTLRTAEQFIKEFFEQNPLSQMGVLVTHGSSAEKLSELHGNVPRLLASLQQIHNRVDGEISLQSSLELARASLRYVPKHGSREVLILLGSFASVDATDIHATVAQMAKDGIRCSTVGIGAEVFLFKQLARVTGGTYSVALNEEHHQELVLLHCTPPVADARVEASLVPMGFPLRETEEVASFCVCHKALNRGGYFCPRCRGKYCELPTDCQICSLTLVSSPHLARSYHHLFPVPIFTELNALPDESEDSAACFGCQFAFESTLAPAAATALASSSAAPPALHTQCFQCPKCKKVFCVECDIFIHESLHTCPGCELQLTTSTAVRGNHVVDLPIRTPRV